VFDHKIEFFNPGNLPEGITIQKLFKGNYVSVIRNKKIADLFKEAGLIEKYGSGIKRILMALKTHGLPEPEFEEISAGFRVTVYKQPKPTKTAEVTAEVMRILPNCTEPISRRDLMQVLGLSHEEHFRKSYLVPALETGFIERTIPDKPRSRLQKYRLTGKGGALLRKKKA